MSEITSRKQLPDMPYFVLCNDPFMSGWGDAKGKINTIILPCRSMSEALIVEAHAKKRGDQNRIRIVSGKPKLRPNSVCYSLHNWEDYSTWYTGHMRIVFNPNEESEYAYKVTLEGAGFDRRGYNWGGMFSSFWDAFNRCAEIAESCGYYQIDLTYAKRIE